MIREITKLHEETVTGTLPDLAARYAEAPPRGEIVIVVGPPAERAETSDDDLDAALKAALATQTPSRAAADVAEALNIPRKRAYARALALGRSPEPAGKPSDAAAAPRPSPPGGFGSTAGGSWRRRANVRGGEIDLVARRGTHARLRRGQAARHRRRRGHVARRHRLRRVAAAAEQLAPRYARANDDIRIDAIFIVPRRLPRHLADVWQG